MSFDIKSVRATRNNDFSKIIKEFEQNERKDYNDDRFWKLERDKAGNGSATIRFLPSVENALPWVKLFTHGFKGPTGKWYIENSLTTINKGDPVNELNIELWNSTNDDKSPARKQVRDQKRKLNYISNILVVNDPKHPENNGKVFLFKYGKKIFDKIIDKAKPLFEDQEPVNVFDFWEGANFKLRIKQADGFPNYDSSEFESPAPISDSDEEIMQIANKCYKLSELIDESNFKTYEQLKQKLNAVLGLTNKNFSAKEVSVNIKEIEEPIMEAKVKETPEVGKSKKQPLESDNDDEMVAYFQSLADE
jgi:hypothetical protein